MKNVISMSKVEYLGRVINPFKGCSHGCLYPCYAYQNMKRFLGTTYEEWTNPSLKMDIDVIIDKLSAELKRLCVHTGIRHNITLCSSTDPFDKTFNPEKLYSPIYRIIDTVLSYDNEVTLLTKGKIPQWLPLLNMGYTPVGDISLVKPGISLISLDEDFRKKWEPGAVSYEERVYALREYIQGCYKYGSLPMTWVSMEPFPTPDMANVYIDELVKKVHNVDLIIFGMWNYRNPGYRYKKEFYTEAVIELARNCESFNIQLYVKNDVKKLLGDKYSEIKENFKCLTEERKYGGR